MPTTDEQFMGQALVVAEEGLEKGELPIGAVIVADGKIIASAHTQERSQGRYLVHADLLALEAADRIRPFPGRRRDATLYVNLEPCMMCVGAAMSCFIGNICFGLESPGDGATALAKQWSHARQDFPGYQVPAIRGGVLRDRTLGLFKRYVDRNPTGPMTDWARTFLSTN